MLINLASKSLYILRNQDGILLIVVVVLGFVMWLRIISNWFLIRLGNLSLFVFIILRNSNRVSFPNVLSTFFGKIELFHTFGKL